MSDRFVHQAPCGTCRGVLEFWYCPPCGCSFSWCPACGLARADAAAPAAEGVRRPRCACPAGHGDEARPPSIEELAADGLAAVAVLAVEAPQATRPGGPSGPSVANILAAVPAEARGLDADSGLEAAKRLWIIYLGLAIFAAFVLLDEGADMRVPVWLLAGMSAAMVAVGWPAWPRFVRDPVAIGLAVVATGLTLVVLGGAAAAGGPGEFLRAPWRWGLLYGGMAAVCAAYMRAPEAVPRWLDALTERATNRRWGP